MADYYPLIARAVAGLEKNTGDARRALYERARTALVAQLRGVTPALNESDVTRERLALEEAIRKVEAESARQSWVEPQSVPRMRPQDAHRWDDPAPPHDDAAPPSRRSGPPPQRTEAAPRRSAGPMPRPAGASAAAAMLGEQRYVDPVFDQPLPEQPQAPQRHALRGRPAERRSLSDSGLKDFRNVVSEANELGEAPARANRSARDAYAAVPGAPAYDYDQADQRLMHPQEFDPPLQDLPAPAMLEPSFALDESRPMPPRSRMPPRAQVEGEGGGPTRSFGDFIRIAVALLIIAGLGSFVVWQWPNMVAVYRWVRAPAADVAKDAAPTTRPKIVDRIEPGGQTQPSALPGPQGAAVAQRVVLYEEDPAEPAGKRFVGSAIWRTETVSPGPGQSPELAIRADIEIPERRLAVTWSLRRNTDQTLPATHTVEIMFRLPPDFPAGGISNVPGILMKQAEQTRGVPLAGLAVKVTNGFFLIGLSSVDADRERNVQLLKERAWFDIPVVYNNNRRAILALEKGTPGERVFADAFRAWGQ